MDLESIEKLSRQILKKLRWIEIALTSVEKGSSEVSIESLAVESY